jgi:GNAT superfamily N-acetyltransferase
VVSFREEHLPAAAALVGRRYAQLHEQNPLLPARYAEVSELLPLLRSISANGDCGVAAIREGRLVGFLAGWRMPSFRGQKSTYSPEWANAAKPGESRYIYEEMYRHLAENWILGQYVAHYVSLFPTDRGAAQALQWLGFGMTAVDALRSVDAIPSNAPEITIRQADVDDLEAVLGLDQALWQHVSGTPSFLPLPERGRAQWAKWLQEPSRYTLLAFSEHEPVAYMSLGAANEDVATIIVDDRTTSIYGAFTKAQARGQGVATALLARALERARAAGYRRCAVDFESMNLDGTRFWLKHFNPVCYSFFRLVDPRVLAL